MKPAAIVPRNIVALYAYHLTVFIPEPLASCPHRGMGLPQSWTPTVVLATLSPE